MKTLNGPRVHGISPVGEKKVYEGKDLPRSQVLSTGFVQILEKCGKSWNLMSKFSRPRKALKMIVGMEKSGKILVNGDADLENIDVCYTVDYQCIC